MLCSVFIEARCFQYEQCCVCVRFYLRSNMQRCVNQELREEQADFSPPLLLLLFCQACELTKPKKSGKKPSPLPQTEKGGQGRRGRGWQQRPVPHVGRRRPCWGGRVVQLGVKGTWQGIQEKKKKGHSTSPPLLGKDFFIFFFFYHFSHLPLLPFLVGF